MFETYANSIKKELQCIFFSLFYKKYLTFRKKRLYLEL